MRIGLDLSHNGRTMLWRPLEPGCQVVGSNPECDLCIPDDQLPPVQCVIERRGNSVTLTNRHPGGTRVGDELFREPASLANDDVIYLGPVTARVQFIADVRGARTRTLVPERVPAPVSYEVSAPDARPGERWAADSGVAIGSDESNDLVLDDPFVSSFHARISVEDGRCVVRDLGSRNGVFVAERKLREGEVPPGAQVRVGRTVLVVTAAGPLRDPDPVPRLVGDSPAIHHVRQLIRRIATSDAPVLITGETGTGKEVVARLLAEHSPRAARPFVVLNCGSLSRNLIESELFGHEKGAFTGAVVRKTGAFEAANHGTLFLDEIGELPVEVQPQLLRVLETGEVRRVGSTEVFHVDVRVLAATNRKLGREVAAGTFREDLFHRLHVLSIELPPLAQRDDDLIELADYFVSQFAPDGKKLALTRSAIERLQSHTWPGNVRELRNVLQRAVLLRRGERLDARDITFTPSTLASRVETASATSNRTLQEIERDAILAELRRLDGNKKEAAAALGISRSTIHRKIEEYRIL
jgi:transcriptional regulator with AAA-type ATPase domain